LAKFQVILTAKAQAQKSKSSYGEQVQMTTQENKALIARLYEEVFVKWNMAFVDEVFDPEFVD
jgi:hypothetical protein